ncbi:hypothetical protein [Parasalinivibrio latis]|uniref:hypothetical protein n=1 Tax=Parasalinivibrio latis TaxID=2952610 RepID=UPI003DA47254
MLYNFHPETKEFIGESEARLDPLEKKPLIPAYATPLPPPCIVKEKQAAIFNEEGWQVVSDHRGAEYYLPDGTHHIINSVGEELPADALSEPPPKSIDELKKNAINKILDFARESRASFAGYVDQYKLAGWNDKSQRAQRYLYGTALEGDESILLAECLKRGKEETPEQLATLQSKKAQRLAEAVAIIDGMESAALSAIEYQDHKSGVDELLEALKANANEELAKLMEA